jgi:hypothetical protein
VRKPIEAPSPTLLPDPDAILRLQIEFIAWRDLVDLIPALDIAHCIASIFARRVRISFDLVRSKNSNALKWREFLPVLGCVANSLPQASAA